MHIAVTQHHATAKYKVEVFQSLTSAVEAAWEAVNERSVTLCSLCLDQPYEDFLTLDELFEEGEAE